MEDAFTGEIRLLPLNYVPEDWEPCNGQVFRVSDYEALYTIIGNAFGGSPGRTFNLPDLRGGTPMGAGSGPGLTERELGKSIGSESVTLTVPQFPEHNHMVSVQIGTSGSAPQNGYSLTRLYSGSGGLIARAFLKANEFDEKTAIDLAENTLGKSGKGEAHENRQPYLAMQFCICTNGEYPVRE